MPYRDVAFRTQHDSDTSQTGWQSRVIGKISAYNSNYDVDDGDDDDGES